MIYDETSGAPAEPVVVDPLDPTRRKHVPPAMPFEDLLRPLMRGGRAVAAHPPLDEARDRAKAQLARLHPGIKRFVHPHQYPVGLSRELHDLKTRLVLEQRGEKV
jgi:nicotinate phosphoribosyltransferase